jgi:hypothetical protein
MEGMRGQMGGMMGQMDGMGPMGGRHGMMGGGMGPGAAIDFAAADADKDGKLTEAELTAWRATVTAGIDADKDGKLSADEIAQAEVKALTARIEDHAKEMVTRLDTDGDGLLSAAELLARPMAGPDFQHLDRNGDGAVTEDELAPGGAPAAQQGTAPAQPAPTDSTGN